MPRIVFALVIVAVALLAGFGAWQSSFDNTADLNTKTNETFTPPNAGENYSVSEPTVDGLGYGEGVVVYDENDTQMSEGSDYEWHPSDGNLTVLSGGGLVNDSNASITYDYYSHTQEETQLLSLWASFAQWLPALVFLLGIVFLVAVVQSMGS